jgi:hypothetical protein
MARRWKRKESMQTSYSAQPLAQQQRTRRHEIVPRSAPLLLPGLGSHTEHTQLLVHVYRSVDACSPQKSFKAPPTHPPRAEEGEGGQASETIFLSTTMVMMMTSLSTSSHCPVK